MPIYKSNLCISIHISFVTNKQIQDGQKERYIHTALSCSHYTASTGRTAGIAGRPLPEIEDHSIVVDLAVEVVDPLLKITQKRKSR
jgi:hypothetical protein